MGDEDRLIAERYRVIARVGQGGMGVVWLAYDEKLHRKVAVKRLIIPGDLTGSQADAAIRRAVREGRIAAKVQHRNAISLFDVFQEDGQAYLVMEYLPARSLSQVLADRGTLSPVAAAAIGAQVADALSAAHAAGVVHRDVKPGNVLVDAEGLAKIGDFGISRAMEDPGSTTSGMLLGTPAYLSPEVAKGEQATFASDVYSLGATLFTMIEGTPPAGANDNTMALLYKIASGDLTRPANAGPMTDTLERMLRADPRTRPTMAEVRESLSAVTTPDDVTTSPEPVPVPPPSGEGRKRKAALVMAALAGLAVAAVLVTLAVDRAQPGTPNAAPPPNSTVTPTAEPPEAPKTTLSALPPSPPASPTTPPPTATVLAGQPLSAAVITDYYSLMPGNLQEAWTRLTPKYQQHPAGGRGGYQTFWGRIRGAQVSGVSVLSENAVEATVQYNFKDGRVVRERHRYQLIRQDGRWLIDESTVLSSRTL